jgi:hypothetical protein
MLDQTIEPLGISIQATVEITGESLSQVKEKLRRGIYLARKSGRRTIVDFQSVKAHWQALPAAKYRPSKRQAGGKPATAA